MTNDYEDTRSKSVAKNYQPSHVPHESDFLTGNALVFDKVNRETLYRVVIRDKNYWKGVDR